MVKSMKLKSKNMFRRYIYFLIDINDGFKIVSAWKIQKTKMTINRVVFIKKIIFVVHPKLQTPKAMQIFDGMNIIIQLKVQSHRNNIETISTTVLHGLLLETLPK